MTTCKYMQNRKQHSAKNFQFSQDWHSKKTKNKTNKNKCLRFEELILFLLSVVKKINTAMTTAHTDTHISIKEPALRTGLHLWRTHQACTQQMLMVTYLPSVSLSRIMIKNRMLKKNSDFFFFWEYQYYSVAQLLLLLLIKWCFAPSMSKPGRFKPTSITGNRHQGATFLYCQMWTSATRSPWLPHADRGGAQYGGVQSVP